MLQLGNYYNVSYLTSNVVNGSPTTGYITAS
jgi:hypothetical protein